MKVYNIWRNIIDLHPHENYHKLANGYATISRLICEIAVRRVSLGRFYLILLIYITKPVIDDSPEKPTQVGGYVNRAGVRARRAIFNEIRINKDLENSADRSVKKIPVSLRLSFPLPIDC